VIQVKLCASHSVDLATFGSRASAATFTSEARKDIVAMAKRIPEARKTFIAGLC